MNQKQVLLIFVLIFLLGAFLRLYDLDRRPIHHDEGVISSFVENILNNGYYEYDPEYHGPLMYYVSASFMILFGKQDFTLRIGDALLGTLTILLIWPMRKYLGDVGMLASAFFIATSPALVYYSRSAFIDVDFVFFYLLFIYSFVEYINTEKNKFLYFSSIAIAFMFLIKEVVLFLIPGILFFVAGYGVWLWFNEGDWKSAARIITKVIQTSAFLILFYFLNLKILADFAGSNIGISGSFIYFGVSFIFLLLTISTITLIYLNRWKLRTFSFNSDVKKYLVPLIISLIISSFIFSVFYTGGFLHLEGGLKRGFTTQISHNLVKLDEFKGHYKSFWYYAKTLYFFETVIFLFGLAAVFLRKKNLFTSTAVFALIYNLLFFSSISYKTPWHILHIIALLCIAAGYAVQRAYDLIGKKREKIFFTIAILFAVAITFISYQISFIKYADEANIPYVYVQATDEFREMLKYIEYSAQQINGKNTTIDILSEEYWPLPWSLREYKNIAWHAKVIENPTGEIAIGNKANETELDAKLANYSKREFHNRPGVEFLVYVRKSE